MAFRSVLSQHNAPVSDAVKEFTKPVNNAVGSDEAIEKSLWQSWSDLINFAASTPHSEQERLVQFIQELRKESSPKKSTGKSVNIWGVPLEWENLPLFGPAVRENWNNASDGSESSDQEGWVNQNAFVARLTAISKPSDPLDFSLYGVWALRSALEDLSPEDELPSKPVLIAAAVWMVYASPMLWERSRDGQVYDAKTAREGESLRGNGWTGCSQERWNLWEERLGIAGERCEDGDTRNMLQEAVGKMKVT